MRKSLSICASLMIFFLSCASVSKESVPKEMVNADKPSSGNEGIRIAVLQPKGVNIPEDQEWLLAMVQSSLTSDFNRFSNMIILERQYLDTILEEQELSMDGNFSDVDYIKIGNLTNAQYIIAGSLTKTDKNSFMLDLVITNPETGERRASFGPKNYATSDIQGISAAKEAAYELLTQMGVEFSPVDRQNLYEVAQSTVSAETALSKGIAAEKRGATLVEVMQYYYQAVDYDSKMMEAIDRLAEMNGKLTKLSQPLTVARTGNLRDDAQAEIAAYRIEEENKRIDGENREVWVKQLTDCENYFADFFKTANAPLELVYSTNITRAGGIDMDNETMPLQFEAALLPLEKSWFRAAQQTIMAVRKELIETGRAEAWGLADWPGNSVSRVSPFTDIRHNYDVSIALLDENENTIADTTISLYGGWNCIISNNKMVTFTPYYDSKIIAVLFSNVRVADITDTLSIRIVTINNQDAQIASENGVLAMTPNNEWVKKQAKKQKAAENFDKWINVPNINGRFFLGYVYTPELPVGFLIGGGGNRVSLYWSFSFALEYSNLPKIDNPSNPIETREERSMDMLWGVYIRTINNLFIDIGLGFYSNNIYGLFKVKGHDDPVWRRIDVDGGDGRDDTEAGYTIQVGALYSFSSFYLSAGYRQYFNKDYTSSFYIGGGFGIPFYGNYK
jgi:hypothetical protein